MAGIPASHKKAAVDCTFAIVGAYTMIFPDISFLVTSERCDQQIHLRAAIAFPDYVTQIGAMKAGDVFVRIAQLKLVNDVVPHALGGARGECRDRNLWKLQAQPAQLAVVRAKFVAPFRNAVGFINCKQ
jgi:hypothetical protein